MSCSGIFNYSARKLRMIFIRFYNSAIIIVIIIYRPDLYRSRTMELNASDERGIQVERF